MSIKYNHPAHYVPYTVTTYKHLVAPAIQELSTIGSKNPPTNKQILALVLLFMVLKKHFSGKFQDRILAAGQLAQMKKEVYFFTAKNANTNL